MSGNYENIHLCFLRSSQSQILFSVDSFYLVVDKTLPRAVKSGHHYNVSQNCAMKMHFQVLLVAIRLKRIRKKQSKKQNSDSEFVVFVKACFEELSFSVPQLVHFSNTFLCSRYCSSGTFASIQTFTENIFNSSENFWHCQHGSVWQQTQ